jgi:hypothetical protein
VVRLARMDAGDGQCVRAARSAQNRERRRGRDRRVGPARDYLFFSLGCDSGGPSRRTATTAPHAATAAAPLVPPSSAALTPQDTTAVGILGAGHPSTRDTTRGGAPLLHRRRPLAGHDRHMGVDYGQRGRGGAARRHSTGTLPDGARHAAKTCTPAALAAHASKAPKYDRRRPAHGAGCGPRRRREEEARRMAAPSPAAALDGGTKASWRRHWARGLAARGGAAPADRRRVALSTSAGDTHRWRRRR